MKDLTPQLETLEAKDRLYLVKAHIGRLLAPQTATRPFVYKKKGWGEIERVESRQDGTPTSVRAPIRKKNIRKGESEVKSADCWTFMKIGDKLHVPWGGQWGLLKSALRRTLEAQNKMRYENAKLDLIRVMSPEEIQNGHKPCKCGQVGCIKMANPPESMQPDAIPLVVLETRHTQRGDVMVETFFDYLADRNIEFAVQLDSECPLNEEKFVGMLKSISTLDSFGPSKRGQVKITSIQEVKNNGNN